MKTIDKESIIEARLLTLEEFKQTSKEYTKCGDWWWINSSGRHSFSAIPINHLGNSYYYGYDVTHCFGVRPVLVCKNIEAEVGSIFEINNKSFIYIGNNLFLSKDIIDICPFRTYEHCLDLSEGEREWRKLDTPYNNYETSDIKAFIDDWFKKYIIGDEKEETPLEYKDTDISYDDMMKCLEDMNREVSQDSFSNERGYALRKAIRIVKLSKELQPKKYGLGYECPNCGYELYRYHLSTAEEANYCCICGQALNWNGVK